MTARALVGNAEDPQQQRKARTRQQRQTERELNDLRDVLSRPQGRRLLHRLMRQSGLLEGSFASDALTMAYATGQRDVALWLMSEINLADINAFSLMLIEAAKLDVVEATSTEPESTEPIEESNA